MAQFIDSEAMDVDFNMECDNEFIDDSEQVVDEYPYFANVTRSYNDTLSRVEDLDLPTRIR